LGKGTFEYLLVVHHLEVQPWVLVVWVVAEEQLMLRVR
jgi:hypothetical protein